MNSFRFLRFSVMKDSTSYRSCDSKFTMYTASLDSISTIVSAIAATDGLPWKVEMGACGDF